MINKTGEGGDVLKTVLILRHNVPDITSEEKETNRLVN